ncbi:MAG: right-handed parallel beta-helix repeat-containing protein, partial [Planctomycetota bacterium]
MKSINNFVVGCVLAIAICFFLAPPAAGQSVLYVDANATGGDDGSSWDDAYNYLQDALAEANSISGSPVEIWVAEGTYKPDQGLDTPSGRADTFQLINGVAIYGGFPSSGDPNWNDRDPNAYETILSGDIGTPDVNMDNSYHVVTGNGTYETAVIDGFIISGGNANGSYPYNRGGGMHNLQGSPTVTNCTFIGNLAGEDGGGMYNRYSSSPIVNNCAFNGNWADQDGGGVCNFDNSNPTLIDCSFSGNWAGDDGGGVYNQRNSNPTLINCSFTGNSVGHDGGGIGNWASNPTLNNCTFSGNSAIDDGGGIWCWWGSSPTITGCTINGNTAGGFGGGVYSDPNGSPTVNNCTISNNGPDGIWAEGDGVRIVGTVYIISNNLAGSGTLQIDPDATL